MAENPVEGNPDEEEHPQESLCFADEAKHLEKLETPEKLVLDVQARSGEDTIPYWKDRQGLLVPLRSDDVVDVEVVCKQLGMDTQQASDVSQMPEAEPAPRRQSRFFSQSLQQ